MSNILPFGTSTDAANPDVAPIKLFGCTVIDFNVSADWSSQAGSLSCRLIESDTDGDRLIIPVLGTPTLFEMRTQSGTVLFQYVGIVESFSRSSSNEKIYSVSLSSPLRVLDNTTVILSGYTGLGGTIEGFADFSLGIGNQDYGHNNSFVSVVGVNEEGGSFEANPGTYSWTNVSNLINVFGILENDDLRYRVGTAQDDNGNDISYGGFGFSGKSQDGLTLIKLMWALHVGINHLPPITFNRRQKTLGGNLLYGRHNYNSINEPNAIPYYYHFDALHFYNQVVSLLGSEYRVAGEFKSLKEIIAHICDEANLEFYCYIDIGYGNYGNQSLQEYDPNWSKSANLNWTLGINPTPFTLSGGNYGGTIRVNTISKNTFFNAYRPFSNIAYNLIGLEVPDLKNEIFGNNDPGSGIHPGRRPVNDIQHGLTGGSNVAYSDPLDSQGYNDYRFAKFGVVNDDNGFTKVGTMSVHDGGRFPTEPTGSYNIEDTKFDQTKMLNDLKVKNSDVSIKLNDATTMKVITGGYQTRIVSVPRNLIRHYWGDIIVPTITDPRVIADTETDPLGLNETAVKKVPVVTPLLDPRDVDDYILIDMKSDFGTVNIPGVMYNGVYAASMVEIRCAMSSFESWKAFFESYKFCKLTNLINFFYPNCNRGVGGSQTTKEKSTEQTNEAGGLGYVGVSDQLGLGNTFASTKEGTKHAFFGTNNDEDGDPVQDPGKGYFGLGFDITCALAQYNIKKYILPLLFEKVKEIGDTHYGKSWYVPVPYAQTIQDLDGNALVGGFKRSWELTDSAYVEPSLYYGRKIPQSSTFISDGKVSPFVNYDHNFLAQNNGEYDTSYAQDLTNTFGTNTQICNFSEYSLDSLCMTKYGNVNIIHASPENISDSYSFLPFPYERLYNRALLPFSSIVTGRKLKYNSIKSTGVAPTSEGQEETQYEKSYVEESEDPEASEEDNKINETPADEPLEDGESEQQIPNANGYFSYSTIVDSPCLTHPTWLSNTVSALQSLDYNDNGRFCFPFVKCTTSRVFFPVPSPAGDKSMGKFSGFNVFLGTNLNFTPQVRQTRITDDPRISVLRPFQACVAPKTINYAQVSTRYVYGPWMTSLPYIAFRGKIEYEQDDSLVPENFLIPQNFGKFGDFTLSQVSGFTGMNLAAQGRANSIDAFNLFAVEEGSITVPGGPAITRIGDSLYSMPQVTDIKINVSNDKIETTYGFKTISPKFGKNTRELEKKLTKISNDIKKIKLT